MVTACLVYACASPVDRAADQPQKIAADARSNCSLLGTIVKRAAGYASSTVNTKRAMDQALDAVRDAGGDSYYVLDVDSSTSGRGTQVVMEAYDCY